MKHLISKRDINDKFPNIDENVLQYVLSDI